MENKQKSNLMDGDDVSWEPIKNAKIEGVTEKEMGRVMGVYFNPHMTVKLLIYDPKNDSTRVE